MSKTRLHAKGDETDVSIDIDNGAHSKFDMHVGLEMHTRFTARGHTDNRTFLIAKQLVGEVEPK